MVFTTEVGSFLPCDVPCLCVILWAGPNDSILTNGLWDCIIKKSHTHNCGFSLFFSLPYPPFYLSPCLPPSPHLPPSLLPWRVNCHDVSWWEQSYGEAHMVWWGIEALFNIPWESSACQKPHGMSLKEIRQLQFSLGWWLYCNFTRDAEPESFSWAFSEFLAHGIVS